MVCEALWSVLFPPRCVGCERRGTPLCLACRADLPYLRGSVCRRCALPRLLLLESGCRGCRQLSPALLSVRAACAFEAGARRAVHLFKFRSARHLAPVLAAIMAEEIARRPVAASLLVPVPISPRRLRERGYNQAAVLAEHLARARPRLGRLRAGVLERQDRPAQQTLDAAERWRNLRDAIGCREPSAVRGRNVLLCDDVMTTGATLSACADALADAGARNVRALVFARDL